MYRFHVSGAFRTTSGSLATFGRTVVARNEGHAKQQVMKRIASDARRRWGCWLNTHAIILREV